MLRGMAIAVFLASVVSVGSTSFTNQLAEEGRLRSLTADTVHSRLDAYDVVVRMDTTSRNIYFVFSADSMFEGAPAALDALAERNMCASFFFTGNFLRDSLNAPIIRRVIREGHYVGPHSDRHILLADWDRSRTPLVTADSLAKDLRANFAELSRFGIRPEDVPYALPPFEWCSRQQAHVYRGLGIMPVNPTPELETYRDYTTPDMPEYRSSRQMLDQLFGYEAARGLNGAIIILHLGTQDVRTDKLYFHLPAILDSLTSRGYVPVPLPR